MKSANHLIVFAKTPRLGAVKQRLAAGIGAVHAAQFHFQTVRSAMRHLGHDPRWRCVLAVTPDRDANCALWDRLGAGGTARVGQGTGDLGARMARALASQPPGRAVLVGTDIPELRPRHIAAAFRALGSHDLAFGPATDGGFWLIGVNGRRHLGKILAGVRWSSQHALADTLANVPARLSVAMLDRLSDIDDAPAYAAWKARR